MSLVYLTDIQEKSVAVNPAQVVAVFEAIEGDQAGQTIINLLNGHLIVKSSVLETVAILNQGM